MYKVFINDHLLILTDKKNSSGSLRIVNYEDIHIFELVEKMLRNEHGDICLISTDLNSDWNHFKSSFIIQEAAGGKVFNDKNEVLFIYRFDRWDLPKGKLEQGEDIEHCALREVEEECGVTFLNIVKPLDTTFHIFKRKGKTILKVTYWFLMNTKYDGQLTPQLDEGIVDVRFINLNDLPKTLSNTYGNIRLLFENQN